MNTALIVGISNYPPGISKLPAVAADVREVGKILGSKNGMFSDNSVTVLTEDTASRATILRATEKIFRSAGPDDTVLVYMAGHGSISVTGNDYYFVAHDTSPNDVASTGVPLAGVKELFNECRSHRVFLWLDFCHSGGIIARRFGQSSDIETQVFVRTLEVESGEGKMIYAACTSDQYAYEDSGRHGVFTGHLLEGLRGGASVAGEVTANSLFDFISRKMSSSKQQPMQFGHMTGRVVFVHVPDKPTNEGTKTTKAVKTASKAPTVTTAAVNNSEDWCLLGKDYFKTRSVQRAGTGIVTLEIVSKDDETDALLGGLRPNGFGNHGQMIPFAHRTDAEFVRITDIASTSQKSTQVWTLQLKSENIQQGMGAMEITFQTGGKAYSPHDLACMRAGRILLNEPPPAAAKQNIFGHGGIGEMYIKGFDVPIPATECVVRSVITSRKVRDKTTLQMARLSAIVALKGSNVCEQILELALGPIAGEACHVRFRGVRRRQFVNVEPTVIELEGECSLS